MRHERVPVVLKQGETAWAAGRDGGLEGGDHGLYAHDARWLRRYRWCWPDDLTELRLDARGPARLRQRLSRVEEPGGLGQASPRESLAVRRTLRVRDDGVDEELVFAAWPEGPVAVQADLTFEVAVEDVFEVRGFVDLGERPRTARIASARRLEVEVRAPDGVIDRLALEIDAEPGLDLELRDGGARLRGRLPAGAERRLRVAVTIQRDETGRLDPSGPPARLRRAVPGEAPALPDPVAWRDRLLPPARRGVLESADDAVALAAADDLRALLLPTPHGPVPAAGVPWYVTLFGRDALLSVLMLPAADDAARATLRLLAALQGRRVDPSRAEAPGKIPHEMRVGAATRTGQAPFGPHYGTVDATPLWVMALGARVAAGDEALARELEGSLRRALGWLREAGDPEDGLLRFASGEGGYQVQSWKDAGDSMTHADGRLARGRLAVVEVQGYAEAAWRVAADLLAGLGDADGAADAADRADRLRGALAQRFFRPGLGAAGCHALAIDEAGDPLEVVSSDPGHLLWTGSIDAASARAVAASLLAPEAWSGWGVRTLAKHEVRYAAVSYHCGSVWPHDTALFALGLERYGLHQEASQVARAVLDLAAARADRRAPELIAGDERDDGPPAGYPDACRLQAWSAAAVLAMHGLLTRRAEAMAAGDAA
jgi:glycogen debranching enzyme